jgi:hypothetical protein
MRIVALSDQHGFLPAVPPCDLLLVAGDVCVDRIGPFPAMVAPDQQARWFDRTIRPWLATAPATHKILTWGNHDWCGQACDFSDDAPGRASTTSLQIVVDERTTVAMGEGARSISVWASPWSRTFMNWAFMMDPAELAQVYAAIPGDIDILVSHQPPYGHGDQPGGRRHRSEHLGCPELLAAVERIRPKLVVCGHIHGGHGPYDHDGIPIYNVSVVDEQYRLVHEPTVIDL